MPLKAGDVPLAPGEGILTKCEDDGYGLQSAGQVLTDKDMPTVLRLRSKMVANVTPVDVDLTDCYVTGYDPFEDGDGGAYGEVVVQILDDRGKNTADYYWYDYSEDGETYFGWYVDGDTEQPLEKGVEILGPGQGVLTKCEDDGYSFVWPKVDVK